MSMNLIVLLKVSILSTTPPAGCCCEALRATSDAGSETLRSSKLSLSGVADQRTHCLFFFQTVGDTTVLRNVSLRGLTADAGTALPCRLSGVSLPIRTPLDFWISICYSCPPTRGSRRFTMPECQGEWSPASSGTGCFPRPVPGSRHVALVARRARPLLVIISLHEWHPS